MEKYSFDNCRKYSFGKNQNHKDKDKDKTLGGISPHRLEQGPVKNSEGLDRITDHQVNSAKDHDTDPGRLDDFERVWAAYPRKTGRMQAIEAWLDMLDLLPETSVILAGINRWIYSAEWYNRLNQSVKNSISLIDSVLKLPSFSTFFERKQWQEAPKPFTFLPKNKPLFDERYINGCCFYCGKPSTKMKFDDDYQKLMRIDWYCFDCGFGVLSSPEAREDFDKRFDLDNTLTA